MQPTYAPIDRRLLTLRRCRRPTPGSGYLEALCSPKVEIIWGDLDTFNATGVKTESGTQVDADTIICATGFDMSFVPRFPVVGSHGRDLRDDWFSIKT